MTKPSAQDASSDVPAEEFLLTQGAGRVLPTMLVIVAATVLLSTVLVLMNRSRHHPGPIGPLAVAVGGLVALVAVWVVIRRVEWLVARRLWRGRPRPAMRLSPEGLDYSPAYAGDFSVHVDWNHALASGFRRGPAGSRYWCLIVARADGLGPLECVLERRLTVDPGRAAEFAAGQVAIAGALGALPGDVDLLTHLLAFGTPIAINLAGVDRACLRGVDARIQDWTRGRIDLYPDLVSRLFGVLDETARRLRTWLTVSRDTTVDDGVSSKAAVRPGRAALRVTEWAVRLLTPVARVRFQDELFDELWVMAQDGVPRRRQLVCALRQLSSVPALRQTAVQPRVAPGEE